MNPTPRPRPTRRQFLASAAATPALWRLRPWTDPPPRAVVVVELNGGNDALNTVAPVADPAYRRVRPTLALDPRACAPLGVQDLALHPALRPLAHWFGAGQACAVTSIGPPAPDRSHFRAMDVWHTASLAADLPATGWLGRAADALAAAGVEVPALAIGQLRLPLLLQAGHTAVPALAQIEDYVLRAAVAPGVAAAAAGDDLHGFLARTAQAAAGTSARLQRAVAGYRPARRYPDSTLAGHLGLVARVLASGFGTRLFHVLQGGYDTHASQAATHEALLRELALALDAFLGDLEAHRLLEHTLVVVFSEFGRRVAENQSRGTDHGAGGVLLALGPAMRAAVAGPPLDLRRLDQGDLRVQTDFRSVVQAVLQDWLGLPAATLLGGQFAPLGFLAT